MGKLNDLGVDNVLIVVEAFDEKLLLAARNLPLVEVEDAVSVDPVALLRREKVVMTVAAAKLLEGQLVVSLASREERLMTVLVGPHISEKSTIAAETSSQVVFKVRVDATKTEIRQAVEKLFDVKVDNVTVSNVKGKAKRFGQTRGRRSDWKRPMCGWRQVTISTLSAPIED